MEASAEGKPVATKVIARVYLEISGDIREYLEIIWVILSPCILLLFIFTLQNTSTHSVRRWSLFEQVFAAKCCLRCRGHRIGSELCSERERGGAVDLDEFAATVLDFFRTSSWLLDLFHSVTALCRLQTLTGHHENDKNESTSRRLQWGCCGGLNWSCSLDLFHYL